jgi:ubiquitin-protein ligase
MYRQQTSAQNKVNALKRIHRDMIELNNNPLELVCAKPISDDNLFLWHANLMGAKGTRYEGSIFHLELKFKQDYPQRPPEVQLLTTVHRSHVYGRWICLDMLETHHTDEMYTGWSTAYSILSILLQLQAYIFDEDEEYFKPDPHEVTKCIRNALNFKCQHCSHDMKNNRPWPVTEAMLANSRKRAPSYYIKKREIYKRKRVNKAILESVREFNEKKFEDFGTLYGRYTVLAYEIESDQPFKLEEEEQEQQQQQQQQEKMNVSIPHSVVERPIMTIKDLSTDIMIHKVFSYLNEIDLMKCKSVSKHWRHYAQEACRFFDLQRDGCICFHTKMTFRESILGVGINLHFNPYSKAVSYVDSPLDIISFHAYKELGIRKGVWREKFKYWLPLFIDKEHGRMAWPVFEKSICTMYDKSEFDPLDALQLLCMLMNTQIVNVMNGNLHCSIKGLTGYCWFHRWLIALIDKYPQVLKHVNKKVRAFMESESGRSKDAVPIIGDFIPLLSISSVTWSEICETLLEEVFTRNVHWCMQKYPHLNYEVTKQSRINASFDSSRTMNGLLMFHVHFLQTIARPKGYTLRQIADDYDRKHGQPSVITQNELQDAVFYMQGIETFEEFFECVGVTGAMEVHDLLLHSIRRSLAYGYHRPPRTLQTLQQVKDQQLKQHVNKKRKDSWSPWTKSSANYYVAITMCVDSRGSLIPVQLPNAPKKRNNKPNF